MNNEGESKLKHRGDSVTFRLLKKMKYSNDVLELINKSTKEGKCNEEVIKALDFYVRFFHREKEIEMFVQYMDKLKKPTEFSEKVIEQIYAQYIKEKIEKENESGEVSSEKQKNVFSNRGKENSESKFNEVDSNEEKSNIIKLNINNEQNTNNAEVSDEEDIFGDEFGSTMHKGVQSDAVTSTKDNSLSKAMASIRRKKKITN